MTTTCQLITFTNLQTTMNQPKKIEKSGKNELTVTWQDGSKHRLTYKKLRDLCPCATCSGETVLLKTSKPSKVFLDTPGRYDLSGIEPVGNYAVAFRWADGHQTGIYSWDFLYLMGKTPDGHHHH